MGADAWADWTVQDRRISVVCEGEVHNASELRHSLGMPEDCPLEKVIAAGWLRWSTGLLPRLDGVFVVALRDGDRMLLYRDPSGLRNLFYTTTPERVDFSSDLGALAPAPGEIGRLARRTVHEYLRLLDIAAPNTVYEHVKALEPGRYLLRDGRSATLGTADTQIPSASRSTSFAEAIDELDERLTCSIASRIDDAERPAAFLSGGVDSALVCTLSARRRADTTAVTIGFEDDTHDEAPAAAQIAAQAGIAHRVMRFGRAELLDAFARLVQSMDQPMADPATLVTVLAFERCKDEFDVLLDGTGADEAVGALPPRHRRLAVGVGSLVPMPLRRVIIPAIAKLPVLAGYTPLLDFDHPADTLSRWKGFTRPEIETLCGEPVSLAHTRFYRTFAAFPRHAHFERYSALLDAMPCDRLAQAVKLSGARVRFPFCARSVDGWLRGLPMDWRHVTGQPKRILRALLARHLPRAPWDAPKHGFDFPLHEFLAGDRYALVRQHVLEGGWLDRGVVQPDVARRIALAYIGGDRRPMFRVWALVMLGAWLDAHEKLN